MRLVFFILLKICIYLFPDWTWFENPFWQSSSASSFPISPKPLVNSKRKRLVFLFIISICFKHPLILVVMVLHCEWFWWMILKLKTYSLFFRSPSVVCSTCLAATSPRSTRTTQCSSRTNSPTTSSCLRWLTTGSRREILATWSASPMWKLRFSLHSTHWLKFWLVSLSSFFLFSMLNFRAANPSPRAEYNQMGRIGTRFECHAENKDRHALPLC